MTTHSSVQETGIKTIPMEKKCKKPKWLSGEALQIAVKRTPNVSVLEIGPQFNSVAQSCPTLCDPIVDCSTPGLPVYH